MSENNSRQDLSRYDTLTTEELEQILRADALITDEDEAYLEMIVYVAEVYAQRKKNEKNGTTPELQSETKHLSFRRMLRPLVAVAAVVVLVFCGTMTARSMNFDLFGAVAEWTSSIFSFNSPTAPSNKDPLETIERMKPKWLPDGFELVYETFNEDEPLTYHASYEKGEKTINLTYQKSAPSNTDYLEKVDGEIEIFEMNRTTVYVFNNLDRITTVWFVDGIICRISGDISADEMKNVIISIGLE